VCLHADRFALPFVYCYVAPTVLLLLLLMLCCPAQADVCKPSWKLETVQKFSDSACDIIAHRRCEYVRPLDEDEIKKKYGGLFPPQMMSLPELDKLPWSLKCAPDEPIPTPGREDLERALGEHGGMPQRLPGLSDLGRVVAVALGHQRRCLAVITSVVPGQPSAVNVRRLLANGTSVRVDHDQPTLLQANSFVSGAAVLLPWHVPRVRTTAIFRSAAIAVSVSLYAPPPIPAPPPFPPPGAPSSRDRKTLMHRLQRVIGRSGCVPGVIRWMKIAPSSCATVTNA